MFDCNFHEIYGYEKHDIFPVFTSVVLTYLLLVV